MNRTVIVAGFATILAVLGCAHNKPDVVALRVAKDPRSIPVLIEMTNDESSHTRAIALCALGELKATNAFNTIVEHLDDYEHYGGCTGRNPAQAACYALGALGDQRALPYLLKVMKDRNARLVKAYGNDGSVIEHDTMGLTSPCLKAIGELKGLTSQQIEDWFTRWENERTQQSPASDALKAAPEE